MSEHAIQDLPDEELLCPAELVDTATEETAAKRADLLTHLLLAGEVRVRKRSHTLSMGYEMCLVKIRDADPEQTFPEICVLRVATPKT